MLIRQDAATYRPPALPFPDPAEQQETVQDSSTGQHTMQSTAADKQQDESREAWGVQARSQFQIDFNSWTFINHGAFGGASRQVLAAAAKVYGLMFRVEETLNPVAVSWCWNRWCEQASLQLLHLLSFDCGLMSACDAKEKHWQNTPSLYCQCDEHDAGYIPGPPDHHIVAVSWCWELLPVTVAATTTCAQVVLLDCWSEAFVVPNTLVPSAPRCVGLANLSVMPPQGANAL
jgi:hypothetical protein